MTGDGTGEGRHATLPSVRALRLVDGGLQSVGLWGDGKKEGMSMPPTRLRFLWEIEREGGCWRRSEASMKEMIGGGATGRGRWKRVDAGDDREEGDG